MSSAREQSREASKLDLQQSASITESDVPSFKSTRCRIMYIECKEDGLIGHARIGRVYFSKTGKTLYYQGRSFQSLKGAGYKSNYFDVETGVEYWISGPKRDGSDRLYGERLPVEIDEDVAEDYWTEIRGKTPPN